MAKPLLKLLCLIIELGIQLKRQDEHEQKQERKAAAKADPLNYLRKFGRVSDVTSQSANGVRDNTTKARTDGNE